MSEQFNQKFLKDVVQLVLWFKGLLQLIVFLVFCEEVDWVVQFFKDGEDVIFFFYFDGCGVCFELIFLIDDLCGVIFEYFIIQFVLVN